MKLCECGCGKTAPIAKRNYKKKGIRKGEAYRFIHGHNGVRHGLTRRGCDDKDYQREWKRRKTARLREMMTPEEKENVEARKQMGRFKEGITPWNKGKPTGQIPWSKVKTKETNDKLRAMAEKVSASVKELWKNPGYKGGNKPGVSFNLTEEQRRQYSERLRGEKNPMFGMSGEKSPVWLGGISFIPYTPDFNETLKKRIKTRDNFTCQLCGVKKLKRQAVHHIDYIKENCDDKNLLTLCLGCNCKVNVNRDYWKSYFNELMERRLAA